MAINHQDFAAGHEFLRFLDNLASGVKKKNSGALT